MKPGTNDAVSAATRTSHAQAKERPAPAAAPFTAASTGFSRARTSRTLGWYEASSASPIEPESDWNSFRSCPAQKPLPAPVTTTQRTAGSAASVSAACSASCIARLKAL